MPLRRALFNAFNSLNSCSKIAASLPGLKSSKSLLVYERPNTSSTNPDSSPKKPDSSPEISDSFLNKMDSSLDQLDSSSSNKLDSSPNLDSPPMTSISILQNLINPMDNRDHLWEMQKTNAFQDKSQSCICDVWSDNLYQAFERIRGLRKKFSYIAMDTEFPGIYCKYPADLSVPPTHYQYDEIRSNVDCLKLIQLGLTLMDANGNTPPGICTWQFNFKFSLLKDMYAQDSIKLLVKSGIQFLKHESEGIEHDTFSYYFITSGLVLTNDTKITWITFQSGYDFAYLTRILSGRPMPMDDVCYINLVKTYFPNVFDIKFLMLCCRELYGGLQDVADRLGVLRHGFQHQAGSDSLLTGRTFFRIREMFFDHHIDENTFNGCMFGFRSGYGGTLKLDDRRFIIECNVCTDDSSEDDTQKAIINSRKFPSPQSGFQNYERCSAPPGFPSRDEDSRVNIHSSLTPEIGEYKLFGPSHGGLGTW